MWAAHHRKHHRVADKPGDPHSPHLDFEPGFRGMMAGLWHSHLGWLFDTELSSDPMRYCPDLVREKPLRWLSQHLLLVTAAGVVFPGLLAFAITGGSVKALLTGALWGGLVRIFLINHVTYAVNSIGHYFGRRRFTTTDQSRNVAWLAVPSFGEAWHNNHHAFPRSARHGMKWYEVDLSAILIWSLEKTHLAWKVIRIDTERMEMREAGVSRVSGVSASKEELLEGQQKLAPWPSGGATTRRPWSTSSNAAPRRTARHRTGNQVHALLESSHRHIRAGHPARVERGHVRAHPWREVSADAHVMAAGLRAAGVGPGTRVATILTNTRTPCAGCSRSGSRAARWPRCHCPPAASPPRSTAAS
ncbi:fatty acid desaturase [Streptomyces sp. M19]